jgi:HSP20 family protein
LRRITVPFEPDVDKVAATFDKGVLKIVVPRSAAAAKDVRKIPVTSS